MRTGPLSATSADGPLTTRPGATMTHSASIETPYPWAILRALDPALFRPIPARIALHAPNHGVRQRLTRLCARPSVKPRTPDRTPRPLCDTTTKGLSSRSRRQLAMTLNDSVFAQAWEA